MPGLGSSQKIPAVRLIIQYELNCIIMPIENPNGVHAIAVP